MSTSQQRGQGAQHHQHHRGPRGGVVSEREYLQAQIDALAARIDLQLDAMQRATELSAARLDVRLEGMNEIRAQLGTQRAEFATNEKFDAWGTAMAQRIEILMKQDEVNATTLRERMDRDVKTINDDIRSLRESRSAAVGSGTTSREWLAAFLAIAAIAGALLGHFIR